MDVEKLKKMNQLAALLRKNRIVEDRMEAANMAGALAGDCQEIKDMFMITPDQKMVIKDDYERAHGHLEAGSHPAQPAKPALTEDRMLQVMQAFADQFVAAVNKLEAQMQAHEQVLKELRALKENAAHQPLATQQAATEGFISRPGVSSVHIAAAQPAASVSPSPVSSTEVPSSTQMAHIQNDAAKSTEHPRSGSYQPADVAIDKIFYFGTHK